MHVRGIETLDGSTLVGSLIGKLVDKNTGEGWWIKMHRVKHKRKYTEVFILMTIEQSFEQEPSHDIRILMTRYSPAVVATLRHFTFSSLSNEFEKHLWLVQRRIWNYEEGNRPESVAHSRVHRQEQLPALFLALAHIFLHLQAIDRHARTLLDHRRGNSTHNNETIQDTYSKYWSETGFNHHVICETTSVLQLPDNLKGAVDIPVFIKKRINTRSSTNIETRRWIIIPHSASERVWDAADFDDINVHLKSHWKWVFCLSAFS